ncbi:MAG: hypothetical protein ABIS86_08440, partial [Streptosporangiaceae bacterium]
PGGEIRRSHDFPSTNTVGDEDEEQGGIRSDENDAGGKCRPGTVVSRRNACNSVTTGDRHAGFAFGGHSLIYRSRTHFIASAWFSHRAPALESSENPGCGDQGYEETPAPLFDQKPPEHSCRDTA